MTGEERKRIIDDLERYGRDKRKKLKALGIPASTYYYWKQVYQDNGPMALDKRKPTARRIWNRVTEEEEAIVLELAKRHPELSSRLLAVKITDSNDFYVSESKVYGILKRNGLIAPRPMPEYPAKKEWQHKTTRPNEIWQLDGTNLFVVGWGFYKLLPILDDYSRKIIAWVLMPDETGGSASSAVEAAIEAAGIKKLPEDQRPMLLSDNGPGFISEELAKYLRMHSIRHIFGKPYHPQTQGKIERFNRRIKGEVCLVVYCSPDELRRALKEAIDTYNATPHEALKNVSPNDMYEGRQAEILAARQEKKRRTLARRKAINLGMEENSGNK
jgi:transposase InsO family protein